MVELWYLTQQDITEVLDWWNTPEQVLKILEQLLLSDEW